MKATTEDFFDLIVIGGGPAGSTLASLVKKYNPGRTVLILEKTPFPRHHVGESLLPQIAPILREMGAYEKVDGAGFPRKLGATYVWGKNRTPWDADFSDLNRILDEGGGGLGEALHAWQVQRSRYDEILLRHAEELGAEAREGWRALAIEESEGRVTGLEVSDPHGRKSRLGAGFVADCSGANAFMSRFRTLRRYNEKLKNIAGYSYFRGAPWKYQYTGHPDKTKIFVCSVGTGWFWYIPISPEIVSVGFVTTQEFFAREGSKDFRALYEKALRDCPEIWPLLKDAQRVADVEGTGKDFFMQNDWSYLGETLAGDGWIAAGDAALFVDPILSSGVTLAQLSGHRAAYTIGSYWDEKDEGARRRLLDDYTDFYKDAAASFLVLVLYWYGNDFNAKGWWAEARKAVALPVISDKDAFVLLSSGLASVYEKLHSVRSVLMQGEGGDNPFLENVLDAGASGPAGLVDEIPDDSVPELLYPYEIRDSFLPVHETGRLSAIRKICFIKQNGPEPLRQAVNPKRYALRPQLAILKEIDGRASIRAIRERTAESLGVSLATAGLFVSRFLRELRLFEVVSLRRPGDPCVP